MTPADLERFILAETARAWADLLEMDRERGGTGQLQDTAISLTRNRTMISVHSNYHDDARMLTTWFTLPEPLPGGREPLPGVNGAFLLDLHEWLEGRQPPPKLFVTDPLMTLH
jgi:hypothetical protein